MLEAQFEVIPMTDKDLENITQPCLVLCGELNPFYPSARTGASHLSSGTFVSLAGLNHMSAFTPKVVLPHTKEFLAQVSKT